MAVQQIIPKSANNDNRRREFYRSFLTLTLMLVVIVPILCIYCTINYQRDGSAHVILSLAGISHRYIYNPQTQLQWDPNLKYVVIWTTLDNWSMGQQIFIDNKCAYNNCYLTANKLLNNDYIDFDAVVFAHDVFERFNFPENRSTKHKYVFSTKESAINYHLCTDDFNDFFNWTWTYRLDSDIVWSYMVIRDLKGDIIGPKKDMYWMRIEDMLPVSKKLRDKLRLKTKTMAWFVSNCNTVGGREYYVSEMENEIDNLGLDMAIDKYGICGSMICSRDTQKLCDRMLEVDYRFYLAFENSLGEDYVTEKLLHAVKNKVIPVVYGGSNYSRFLPPGSYLNAREVTPRELVIKIKELEDDFDTYIEYFRWTNHYSYHKRSKSAETNEYCAICALLNDAERVREMSVYHNFSQWWGGCDNGMKCYPIIVNYLMFLPISYVFTHIIV